MNFNKILLIISTLIITSCSRAEYKINISEKKVNDIISAKFPYDKNLIIARLILENPYIDFFNNKVAIDFDYKGNLLDKTIFGSVSVDGDIIYKKEHGKFYLSNFEIRDIVLNSENVNDKSKVIRAINEILVNYFDKIPVYTLKSGDFKESLVKLLLKDIETEEDNFIITLGS